VRQIAIFRGQGV